MKVFEKFKFGFLSTEIIQTLLNDLIYKETRISKTFKKIIS
jgi:hypothetical protein